MTAEIASIGTIGSPIPDLQAFPISCIMVPPGDGLAIDYLRRVDMRNFTIGTFTIGSTLVITASQVVAEPRSFRDMPIPVQSYILKAAVESGVTDPWAIQADDNYDDSIPKSNNSDLNSDGKRDYAVSPCMFAGSTQEFRTNGFPCAYGALIISNQSGGYDFTDISGLVVDSIAGTNSKLIIRERGFDRCQDYMCDVVYELKIGEYNSNPKLRELKICEVDKCKLE